MSRRKSLERLRANARQHLPALGGQKDQRDLDAAASLEALAEVQKREYESSRRVLAEQKRQKKQQRQAQERATADAVQQETKEQARATRDAHEMD